MRWACRAYPYPGEGVMTDELAFLPASTAAEMIRRREVSARELTELVLTRIETLNPEVNAVVEVAAEAALHEAAAADEAVSRGRDLGPWHGVPTTVKDSFNLAGMHTTWGNPEFRDYVADWDATVVRRLREAGAVIVGKTNVHHMLADFGQTANDLYGVTNNPWDLTRAPGGSTGGGAAALAAGLTFAEYGSDLAGSIRIPASFCGVYGLKPTVGTVPLTGFQPPGPRPDPSDMTYLSAVGPLGRSARDLRTALRVTAGPEHPAAKAWSWRLPASRHTRLRDFRLGYVLDHDAAPVSSDVGDALADAVDAVAKAGATVVEGWPDGVDATQNHETFGYHLHLFFAYHQGDDGRGTLIDLVARERHRMSVRAAWARYFSDVDVFLCPTNFTAAFPHDSRPFDERTISTPDGDRPYADQTFWIAPASLPGLPAASAPVGTTPGGLPVGAQVIGPMHEDDTAITFAELLGDVVGGYQRPPLHTRDD
jgi:amidase